jgi:hypothetical protein
MSKTVKLFLSLGLVATLSACGSESPTSGGATTPNPQNSPVAQSPSEGGEGGEGEEYSSGEKANAEFKDTLSGPELLSELQKEGWLMYSPRMARVDSSSLPTCCLMSGRSYRSVVADNTLNHVENAALQWHIIHRFA